MRIHVEFSIYLPENTRPEHIAEWLETRLGVKSAMKPGNPLKDKPLEAWEMDWTER